MKYIPLIIIGVSISLLTPNAYACSCARSDSSFIQLAKKSELVIRGKVIGYQWHKDDKERKTRPLAMTVEVNEVYKGKAKLGKVTVCGGQRYAVPTLRNPVSYWDKLDFGTFKRF
jgi:hypothetical protein